MLQTATGTTGHRAPAAWCKQPYAPAARTLDPLALHGTRITLKRGQEVFPEGGQADACYRLISGNVRLVKLMLDGRRQVCEFLTPGALLGFETDGEHYFSAEAITECTLVRYSRRAVEALLTDDKAFARTVRNATARDLQSAYARMVLLCHKSAQERIAWFLLEMADRAEGGADEIDLPMTRTDIANYLGMAIETVSRALSQFKQARTIAQKTLNRIQIIDREALELARGQI